ncbi:MAG: dTDP-4-dehydrorhamnose reductase [Bacteroidales bacterium]|jgi:dTDP-4-dehydrorhamnose reductase|nr:dTDP-4-dehydrorhamnose reductase [Bacteroidales bacterium]
MNILVTGAYGQLGSEMKVISAQFSQYNFIFTDVDTLDICNESALRVFFSHHRIHYIVNCAAYTAVDKAEDDAETAHKINCDAVENLARMAVEHSAKMIHISTDYVFDGTNYLPYTESVTPCPHTVYGKSKLAGEKIALSTAPQHTVIIRTSWLYSSFGNNFVKTILKLGVERDSLHVIFDQVGTPTYAADLAVAIMQVVTAQEFIPGVYHFSNEGVCSWYDFTIAIHRAAGISTCKVLPIESSQYPAKTPRPHYSVLNKAKIKTNYHFEIPHWENGLQRCIALLVQ